MATIEQLEDTETIKKRMLDFAAGGWDGVLRDYGVSLGNIRVHHTRSDNLGDDSLFLSGHTPDGFVALDKPPQTKLGRRKFGRTLIVHALQPINESRLFPVRDVDEDFEVTSVILDDMSDVVLRSRHVAHIPLDMSSNRYYAMDGYAQALGLNYDAVSLPDLDWQEGDDSDVRTADSLIATMVQTMQNELFSWASIHPDSVNVYGAST